MRAAVMQDWTLEVGEVPDPVPQAGQVLTRVLACGICGSDLHMLRHGAEARQLTAELEQHRDPNQPAAVNFEPDRPTVMGHEFCLEVVDAGPGVERLKSGDVIVSMPIALDAAGIHPLGYSNLYPGGYSELMVVNEMLALDVPNGLDADVAAMTEPYAVGVHAVAKSRIEVGEAAIVIGLGPVGLACIADLKRRGIGPIVGADFSPRRRELAAGLGCDVVVDPAVQPAIEAWREIDGARQLVIFEAVGVPGMLDAVMKMAPKGTRILVVGVCMQADQIFPLVGIGRELNLQFVLGYEPDEFQLALHALADGTVDLRALHTGTVDLDGVPQAFADLANPEAHAKIIVTPS